MTGDETTFDEELLVDGLQLSLIGMGVVFAVLSLLAISIKAFDRVDSLIPESGATAAPKPASTAVPAPAPSETTAVMEQDGERAAAAIAVALALAESDRAGSTRAAGPSASLARSAANVWVAAGRTREMANRLAGRSLRTRSGR